MKSRGLTLLEVILALAILAGSIAVLGELVRIGVRSGSEAEDSTRAQMLCESKLSAILAGVDTPDPVQQLPFEMDPQWVFSVNLAATDQEGMVALIVTVEQDPQSHRRPETFSLVRWIPDPGIELPEETEEGESDE